MDSGNSSNNTRPLRGEEGWEGRREGRARGGGWVVVGRERSESDKERGVARGGISRELEGKEGEPASKRTSASAAGA